MENDLINALSNSISLLAFTSAVESLLEYTFLILNFFVLFRDQRNSIAFSKTSPRENSKFIEKEAELAIGLTGIFIERG